MGFIKYGVGMKRPSHQANNAEELFEEAWKKAPTNIEIKRERGLEHCKNSDGYRYYRRYLDFAHEITKTAIEIDGGYHRTDEQKVKDDERDQELAIKGWYTLRIPAEEVEMGAEWCTHIVLRHIQTYQEQGRRLSFQELEVLVPAPHRQRPISVPQQPAQRPISVPQRPPVIPQQPAQRPFYTPPQPPVIPQQPYTQQPFYTPPQTPVIPQQPYRQRPFYPPQQPPAQWQGYPQQRQYQQPPVPLSNNSQQWQPRQRRRLGFWWALLFGVIAGGLELGLARISQFIGHTLSGSILLLVLLPSVLIVMGFITSRIAGRKWTGTLTGLIAGITYGVVTSIVSNPNASLVTDLFGIAFIAIVGMFLGFLGGLLGTLGRKRR